MSLRAEGVAISSQNVIVRVTEGLIHREIASSHMLLAMTRGKSSVTNHMNEDSLLLLRALLYTMAIVKNVICSVIP